MSYEWAPWNSHLPVNAIHAGNDIDGARIYIGRAHHEGDLLPAKVIPSKKIAYVSHGGHEIAKHTFEILAGTGFDWVASANGHVPDCAIFAGTTSDGDRLYVGRAEIHGSLTPGKVHGSHGCLYLPFNGIEHSIHQYEVLVGRKQEWHATSVHSSLPEGAILAGHDQDGASIYIGRAYHEGDLIPAKVIPSKQVAYVAYGGQEHSKRQYDVLCHGNVSWVRSANGEVPDNAIIAGNTSCGERLYVGRTRYQGSLTLGKIQPSHETLYIPFGGDEISVKVYEVLVEE